MIGPKPQPPKEDSPAAAAEADRLEALKRVPRIGVAIYDNENDMTAGWACSSDGESFYFTNSSQLTNDTLWITSTEWGEFQARGKQTHNLRRIDYLRVPLPKIAADLGLRIDGHYAQAGVYALARVAQQTVSIAACVYNWENPGEELREESLYEDIRRSIVTPPKPKPHMVAPLASAYQSSSQVVWPYRYEEDILVVTLRLNRLDHTRDMLEQLVPDEGWTVTLQGSDIKLDQCLDPQMPCIVEATVETRGSDPDLAILAAFGVSAGKRPAHRRWISQPELAWLCRHTNVRISTAVVCKEARRLPEIARLPKALTIDPLCSLSISAGLVADCHYQALAAEKWQATLKKKTVSAWAVWLRAHDRARCFELALAAHRSGFAPISYGGGAVTVRVEKSRLPALLEFAGENRIAHPCLHPLFVEHGLVDIGQPIPAALAAVATSSIAATRV